MGILTKFEGGIPLIDEWVLHLRNLNTQLKEVYANQRLGGQAERRALLTSHVGAIRLLHRLTGPALELAQTRRPLVGIDGSVNAYGGEFPHYVAFMRAIAKSSRGERITVKGIHAPLLSVYDAEDEMALQRDNVERQRKLADLEVQAALQAIDMHRPAIILMDGPLVRFYMRTRESFSTLCRSVLQKRILLVGCIENIQSRVISTVLGEKAPESWRNQYDHDLLWGTLEFAEVLEVRLPAKGTESMEGHDQSDAIFPIRTWFLRASRAPGSVGIDMLEAQVDEMGWMADYLFTLSPPDGRGIPIWLDLVDREARLTNDELQAYLELLDPDLRIFLASKRSARFF